MAMMASTQGFHNVLTESELARALHWIARYGHLLEFDCSDHTVPAIFRALEQRGLLRTEHGRRVLTDASAVFLSKHSHISYRTSAAVTIGHAL
jgi:hypothetical protein